MAGSELGIITWYISELLQKNFSVFFKDNEVHVPYKILALQVCQAYWIKGLRMYGLSHMLDIGVRRYAHTLDVGMRRGVHACISNAWCDNISMDVG